ncbi:hypothetical protein OS493_024024 [Desmophyllum pertusum]|uniref:Helicase ATP-binding domain-containing protein n=1 Tax=Desmophyllum pertusum TaxID=174260 RepID=A0A9X0D1S9_9CNID|nr:hypothetical protein OS493_024024 [Desmophyllum pertusum]
MADLVSAFQVVCEKFQIETLNHHQKQALLAIVKEKKRCFPKSSNWVWKITNLPLIFDEVSSVRGHIVVVVSPLLNLIQDQVNTLQKLGISAVSLSSVVEDEEDLENKIKYVENGRFSVVYATGTSTTTDKAVFRECYGRLHKLRSLAPHVKIVALTATATSETRKAIMDVLLMDNPYIIYESPDKSNIAYSVLYMSRDESLPKYFEWLVKELLEHGIDTTRTIIYCQTIN